MKWLVLLYMLNACQLLQPAPKQQYQVATMWNGKVYVGDSYHLGVVRSPGGPVLSCSDKDFDRMVCLSLEDYTALMQYFLASACVNQ